MLRRFYRPKALLILSGLLFLLGVLLLLAAGRQVIDLIMPAGSAAVALVALIEARRARGYGTRLTQNAKKTQRRVSREARRSLEVESRLALLEKAVSAQEAHHKKLTDKLAAMARAQSGSLTPAEVVDVAERANSGDLAELPWPTRRKLVAALDRSDPLRARWFVTSEAELEDLSVVTLRNMAQELSRRGYLVAAERYALASYATVESNAARREIGRIRAESRFLRAELIQSIEIPPVVLARIKDRVLHVVGSSVPHTQSGYTVRTHEIAKAQVREGLDVHVVTQMGYGTTEQYRYTREVVDGVTYHRLPGAPRAGNRPDEWHRRHTARLATLVRTLRPGVLHAASDFVNPVSAALVGRAYGIPVIYETRGFWEETWMSRLSDRYGWPEPEVLAQGHGLPDAYTWRRATEERIRREVDAVVTLSSGMAERIERSGVARDRIEVVPNAVDLEQFPLQDREADLAAELGVSNDELVVGYISSLVEYEGVDTLVRAFAEARRQSARRMRLLVVGDGPVRQELIALARELGLADALFPGMVPHSEILRYYGLIDIFVVPRKPVEVCHLVTPLKPFEAFATGRAVVMSDVRALKSIAAESGAAKTFPAGDADALSATLVELVSDDKRRAELRNRGREWVASNRTWAKAAERYLGLYARFGVRPNSPTKYPNGPAPRSDGNIDVPASVPTQESDAHRRPETAVVQDGDEVVEVPSDELDWGSEGQLRALVTAVGAFSYERLQAGADRPDNAEEIWQRGWKRDPYPRLAVSASVDWVAAAAEDRTWAFHLHSWEFMGAALARYDATSDPEYLDWAIRIAASWCEVFRSHTGEGTMAWYDMALGARILRLSYLVEQAIRHRPDWAETSTLAESLLQHFEKIYRPEAFTTRSNHGLYVAVGQIAAARRWPGFEPASIVLDQGRRRLARMVATQFADDGGHVEHSPDYHRMVLQTLERALEYGLVLDDDVASLIERARGVLSWFVQPDGYLVQIGDSPRRRMAAPQADSGNMRGRSIEYGLRVLPDSGYAIVRHAAASGRSVDDSYLALQAGFHSRTHKHADDLSLVWYDRGREILIDSGRYGYLDLLPADSPDRLKGFYYSAPERQYVESTMAHNTVSLDGEDHERRFRTPYGSAIKTCLERDGQYFLSGEVEHKGWSHRRRVVLSPGNWLFVRDDVTISDDAEHDLQVWWNLPEDTVLVDGDESTVLATPASAFLVRHRVRGAKPISSVRGATSPLRGWRSLQDRDFTPALSAGSVAHGVVKGRTVETLLDLRDSGSYESWPSDPLRRFLN